ncbi:hypothetical protein ACWDYJ_02795 [Streptomyces sp. NPDC003042]
MVAAVVIGSTQVSARLPHRVAPRVLITVGLVVAAGGLLLLSGLAVDGGYATQVLPGALLTGFGLGLAFVPAFATATAGIAPQRSGAASATVIAAQHLGGAIGGVLLSGVLAARLDRASVSAGSLTADLLGSYTAALWWAAGSMPLAGLLAGLVISPASSSEAPPVRTAA